MFYRNSVIYCITLVLISTFLVIQGFIDESAGGQPNILFITMDDMNWDSPGCYGSTVFDVTPNIDLLARRGMRFQHAFITSPTCTPSRNVLQTGCYPHVSGVQGFYSVAFSRETVPTVLREAGYYTGIIQKLPDSTPCNDYSRYWDYSRQLEKLESRTPAAYASAFKELLNGANAGNMPFYAVLNVTDPHLPFYRGPKTREGDWDRTPPSRIFEAEDVPIPGFLPQNQAFSQEIADYYCSVKRGDDCVGAVLKNLEEQKLEGNTIIVFLSDHGMSMPFAKSNLYPAGVRTPWIVVWPGVTEPGSLDTEHMISAIDFMPTILEMADVEIPGGLEGRSIVPLVKGAKQKDRDQVFVQLDENPNADVRPMRAVYNRDFLYIFSPWSDGKREALMESRWYRSFGTFAKLAQGDASIANRFDFLKHRTVEELYAYHSDPHALNNLINDPQFEEEASKLRNALTDWMVRTEDYVLPAFQSRQDPGALRDFMVQIDQIALVRARDTEWKRWKNRLGPTEGHTRLYDPRRLDSRP